MKRKLILLQGIPGSGKTTWAKSWVSEDPSARIRVSRDDFREMLGPDDRSDARENLITELVDYTLKMGMISGRNIVVDAMNLNPGYLADFRKLIGTHNSLGLGPEYEIEYRRFFDPPLDECIRRDAGRPKPVGESVIRRIYDKYRHIIG